MLCRALVGEKTASAWARAIANPASSRHLSEYIKLAKFMLSSPATSVENERQFSLMKLLKSTTRNRMGPQLLNGLCRIQRSGYSLLDFPFEESLKVWLAEASRRAVD